MYCKKCDIYLDKNVSVCPTCGNKVKLKKIIKWITLSIISIALIIFLVIVLSNHIKDKKTKEKLNNQVVDIEKISIDNSKTFASYTFLLPNDLQYSNEDNYIYASTKDLKLFFKMNIVEVNYEDVIKNYKQFIEAIVSSGTQVISNNTLNHEGKEYFLLAVIQNNVKSIYAITELDSTHSAQALIESTTDEYETGIDYINKIISNYEKINADLKVPNSATLDDFLITNSSEQTKIGDLFNPKTED